MSVDAIGAAGTGVETVTARIAEIQARIEALAGVASAPAPAPPTSFADVLARTSTPVAAMPAGPVATAASVGARALAAGGGPVPYAAEIQAAAHRHGLDPALLAALIRQESGFDPDARSPAGATGLTQLMPGTAASLGVTDPTDPVQAIDGGARYLRQLLDRFGGDVELALAAYNAGPGAVRRHGGIPPIAETQAYVRNVLAHAEQYRAQGFGLAAAAGPAALAALATPLPAARPASSPAEFGIV
jgi:soluble lytic murein transglycosylase-like protein